MDDIVKMCNSLETGERRKAKTALLGPSNNLGSRRRDEEDLLSKGGSSRRGGGGPKEREALAAKCRVIPQGEDNQLCHGRHRWAGKAT